MIQLHVVEYITIPYFKQCVQKRDLSNRHLLMEKQSDLIQRIGARWKSSEQDYMIKLMKNNTVTFPLTDISGRTSKKPYWKHPKRLIFGPVFRFHFNNFVQKLETKKSGFGMSGIRIVTVSQRITIYDYIVQCKQVSFISSTLSDKSVVLQVTIDFMWSTHLHFVRGKCNVNFLQGFNESAHLVFAKIIKQVVGASWFNKANYQSTFDLKRIKNTFLCDMRVRILLILT